MVEEDDGGYALPLRIKACSIMPNMPSIIYLLALIESKIASLCHVKFQCTISLEEVLRPPSSTYSIASLRRTQKHHDVAIAIVKSKIEKRGGMKYIRLHTCRGSTVKWEFLRWVSQKFPFSYIGVLT